VFAFTYPIKVKGIVFLLLHKNRPFGPSSHEFELSNACKSKKCYPVTYDVTIEQWKQQNRFVWLKKVIPLRRIQMFLTPFCQIQCNFHNRTLKLMHYATCRKVAGSIPVDAIWFFNWPDPSSRTMALGSTRPLTEMSTKNILGGNGRPARKADNLTAIREPTTLWAFMAF
jgi:hypothetical protein